MHAPNVMLSLTRRKHSPAFLATDFPQFTTNTWYMWKCTFKVGINEVDSKEKQLFRFTRINKKKKHTFKKQATYNHALNVCLNKTFYKKTEFLTWIWWIWWLPVWIGISPPLWCIWGWRATVKDKEPLRMKSNLRITF